MSKLIVALLSAVSVAACSAQSPVTPSAASGAGGSLSAKGSATVPGVYELSFNVSQGGTLQEVSFLNVSSQELILKAHVKEEVSGTPAQRGTVTFEYCSYKGLPPNDITRADEAPKEACDQGLADWARLTSWSISYGAGTCPTLGTGYVCVNFGIVRIPRLVGFRFRYAPQGGDIAAGMSESKDFTWLAGS